MSPSFIPVSPCLLDYGSGSALSPTEAWCFSIDRTDRNRPFGTRAPTHPVAQFALVHAGLYRDDYAMNRALLSLALAVLLAVFGVIGTAPADGLQAEPQTVAVRTDASAISSCADHGSGSQMSACGLCAAICASAMAAILPSDFLSMGPDTGSESPALDRDFSDRRTLPAKSPPRS